MTTTQPPGAGFTGVNWELRTSEQLATDLGAGPGPAPLAEAGLAWAKLAAEIGEAGVDYAAVLARLGLNWQSAHADSVFERLTHLAPWFAEAACEAARNAARAEAQAAAATVARLAMPDLAEVGIVETLREIATTATAVAPVMAGAAAEAERAMVRQRMRAARVMQSYETASEPVGKPWPSSRRAPALVSGQALAAEKEAADRSASTSTSTPTPVTASAPAVPPILGGVPGPVSAPPTEKIRVAPVMASGMPQASASAAASAGNAPAGPGVPPPIAPGVGAAAGDRSASVRSVSTDENPAIEDIPASRATEQLDAPLTWADIEVAEQPVIHRAPAVDSRYLEEKFLLGTPGDRA